MAAKNNMLDIVEILLNDPRVVSENPLGFYEPFGRLSDYPFGDPTNNYNFAIENAYKNDNKDIVKRFLEDNRVKNSLPPDELKEYQKWISER